MDEQNEKIKEEMQKGDRIAGEDKNKSNYHEAKREGWVSIYRYLRRDGLWYAEKFSKGQAWIDLILRANHADVNKNWYGEKVIKRGQIYTSKEKLAEDWQWNRKTVSSFLDKLEKRGSIKCESDRAGTLITIVHYNDYQCNMTEEERNNGGDGQPEDNSAGRPNGQPDGRAEGDAQVNKEGCEEGNQIITPDNVKEYLEGKE